MYPDSAFVLPVAVALLQAVTSRRPGHVGLVAPKLSCPLVCPSPRRRPVGRFVMTGTNSCNTIDLYSIRQMSVLH